MGGKKTETKQNKKNKIHIYRLGYVSVNKCRQLQFKKIFAAKLREFRGLVNMTLRMSFKKPITAILLVKALAFSKSFGSHMSVIQLMQF